MLTTRLGCLKEAYGFTIYALDGKIGKSEEFYFDRQSWIIRYLSVDTGDWLEGRNVLLSPVAFEEVDWDSRSFFVRFDKEQIRHSPYIGAGQLVSREYEAALNQYYAWKPYWEETTLNMFPPPVMTLDHLQPVNPTTKNFHLHRARELIGYHLRSKDGEIGRIDDLVVNDADWSIRYLVVDTKSWLAGKKVIVSPWWVEAIDWDARRLSLGISREEIRRSPEYGRHGSVSREYEDELHEHYGRPKYWA